MASETCPASVLLIEDDERLREKIGVFLEDRDYRTVLAEDGEHALELLETMERPCLVLVDPLSRKVDCAKVLAGLQPTDRLATIPIVLVSVHAPELLSRPVVVRRLNDIEILFRIVQQHCCGGNREGGEHGSRRAPMDSGAD